ncbi:uncharacterized protein TNCV_2652881 [Trichonephila clavipes]|nr:uncharacterized protein TNCV_2652881 [Trichonephila clavipes]
MIEATFISEEFKRFLLATSDIVVVTNTILSTLITVSLSAFYGLTCFYIKVLCYHTKLLVRNVKETCEYDYLHYLSRMAAAMFHCFIIGMVIISASDANTAADVAKEAVLSLPGKIPHYYNELKIILKKDCKQNVSLTLWKMYKIDRSLILCALGVLMNYGILIATLGTKNPEGSELAKNGRQQDHQVTYLVTKKDADLALSPRFRKVLIESPL